MKVTIGDITVEFHNGEGESVLDFIEAVQHRTAKKTASKIRSEISVQSQTKVGSGKLNAIQYRTWEFLCENDCSAGIHVSAVARGFGISSPAANTRLIVLEKMGYAKRVQRGYYRALTPEDG